MDSRVKYWPETSRLLLYILGSFQKSGTPNSAALILKTRQATTQIYSYPEVDRIWGVYPRDPRTISGDRVSETTILEWSFFYKTRTES